MGEPATSKSKLSVFNAIDSNVHTINREYDAQDESEQHKLSTQTSILS